MDTSKLQIPPRSRKRSLLGSSASALGTASNASVSTRLNTHVLLGLSVLMLTANAKPLDTTSSSGVVASSTGANGLGGLNLLGIAGKGLSKVGESALGERIIESIGKALGSKPQESDVKTLLGADSMSIAHTMFSDQADTHQDALRVTETEAEGAFHERLTTSDEPVSNPAHFLEDLVAHNPAISFALNIADLMHKMRELFVDIAVLEGEERGLRFRDRPVQDSHESSDSLLEGPNGALGLQIVPDVEVDQVVVATNPDELQFDLDTSPDVSVTIPGSFDVDSTNEAEAHPFLPPGLNPLVNPYAALAMSSVLATLFVVSLMVGRQYFLKQAMKNTEPDLEQGSFSHGSGDNESVEKAAADELDEKALIELNAPAESILTPGSASELDQSEAKEAKEALELLIDVANAALSASILPVDVSNATPAKIDTPKTVAAALETMRAEMNKTPLNLDMEKGSLSRRFLLARSRPATPFRAPSRPQTPSLVLIPAEDTKECPLPSLSRPIPRSSLADSPKSTAGSSYVSAASNPDNAVERSAPSFPTVSLNSPTPSMVHLSSALSVSASPAPSYVTAHPSPAMSYATAPQASPGPFEMALQDAAPIRERIDSPVLSTGAFDSPRPSRSTLALFDQEPQVAYDDRIQSRAYGSGGVVPPAHLTETALNLALMLPATEWVFQFLVVFIGWFGFWMRPVQTSHRRRY